MSLSRIRYPGFFNEKVHILHILKNSAWELNEHSGECTTSRSLGMRCIFMISIYIKRTKLGYTVCKILAWSWSAVLSTWSCTLKHFQFFSWKQWETKNISVKYFRKEIFLKELKITKFRVNFRSMVLKYTFFPQDMLFERALNFAMFLYNTNVGLPFFVKFPFEN